MPRYGLSKRAVRHGFFSRAFFIGLSNLTRTLTIFTLPFYLGLILLLVAIRERRFKAALIYIALMVLGIAIVMLPWLIRQERMWIFSISDNIRSHTRPPPQSQAMDSGVRWTRCGQDSDSMGVATGRMHNGENMGRDLVFIFAKYSLLEYANTFSPRSRALSKYAGCILVRARNLR